MPGMRDANDEAPGQTKARQVAQATKGPAGDLKITLSTDPASPRVGKTQLRIQVKDAAGAPVGDAKVGVTAGMQAMPGPDLTARAGREVGTYEATVNLSMAGAWTVEVRVTSPKGGTTTSVFILEAK